MTRVVLTAAILLLIPGMTWAQGKDEEKAARHNITVILRGVASYVKLKKRYPYFKKIQETEALKRGVKALIEANCLSEKDLIGDGRRHWGLVGFFMPVPPKPKKPLLLLAQHRPWRTGHLLIGLSNGSILKLDTKDREAFREEVSKYLPAEFFKEQQMISNETAAIASLRDLATAQAIFREADKDGDGVADYGTLRELFKANLIDGALGSGEKSGYLFQLTLGRGEDKRGLQHWSLVASPKSPGETGLRSFFVDETTVLRVEKKGKASAQSRRLDAVRSEEEAEGAREQLDLRAGRSVKENEEAALKSLKSLHAAQRTFRLGDKDGDGTKNFGSLKALHKADLIDRYLGAGTRMGFVFKLVLGSPGDSKGEYLYAVTATPLKRGLSGERSFFMDQTGVIRVSEKGVATAQSRRLGD